MSRQLPISILISTICLISCGQKNTVTENQDQQTNTIYVDTSVIAVLPFDTTQYCVFKDSKPTNLTTDDLLKIEILLKKCINDYNPYHERQFKEINDKHPEYKLEKKSFIIDLVRYKRQYVAITNVKGEKEVWVNCFCATWNTDWRKDLILVEDGGNCFFNLKINLTTGQYYELMVNGDA
ncbi:hypothetical protein [Williamwhitmania taraxaci]|uniref:Uncharacterized protein n=1 Tax=Williamwhitmania taraxaci TaxID=1640674 RepID=A0A1G6R6I4_9BACT|nr:hypothetical protein [Williamwhitmania taraxaci]SDD00270.1 hypothetical protein SAMN05216323_107019 [Williamwhitmania taraxaci]